MQAQVRMWWARRYPAIMEDLGFDPERDLAAERLLTVQLGSPMIRPRVASERGLSHQGAFVVAGASSCLTEDLRARPLRPNERLIAADGAVVPLAHLGVRPDLVVTDLDGPRTALLDASATGIPFAIHAHGDNIDALRALVPRLRGPLIGTTQRPAHRGPLLMPGGFTDGDRAVCVALHLGATRIRLVGFDLGGAPGPWSARPNLTLKRRKMWWAERNLRDLVALGVPLHVAGDAAERGHR